MEFGKLHYRELENLKIESLWLHQGDFEAVTSLTVNVTVDVIWWKENVLSSFRYISHGKPIVVLSTDASKLKSTARRARHPASRGALVS